MGPRLLPLLEVLATLRAGSDAQEVMTWPVMQGTCARDDGQFNIRTSTLLITDALEARALARHGPQLQIAAATSSDY
jgi:hypothetical protein